MQLSKPGLIQRQTLPLELHALHGERREKIGKQGVKCRTLESTGEELIVYLKKYLRASRREAAVSI